MLRFSDGLVIEVGTTIQAPPDAVWDVVTDINLSKEYSGEFVGAEWLDEGPALGASFIGTNRRGDYEWSATSWITAFEPLVEFGWSVSDPDNPGSTWTFHLEPTAEGTNLRYTRLLGPGPSGITSMIQREPEREHEILERRNAEQLAAMQRVVDGVKERVEGGS